MATTKLTRNELHAVAAVVEMAHGTETRNIGGYFDYHDVTDAAVEWLERFGRRVSTQWLTRQQVRSIKESIEQCDRYIAKEGPRAADLRPVHVAEMLQEYHTHRAKLVAMLDQNTMTPVLS